jgi:signal transduction histidine kinase
VEEKKREPSRRPVDFFVDLNGETVIADSNGLAQSLRNYLDNAVKFTGRTAEPRVEIGAQANGEKCLLWVRDNGVGFDMKYHDRIFDIFQRLGPTDDYPGTGIGLAIVRKAMERMGGRAWAESKPGEGATFYLEIPK